MSPRKAFLSYNRKDQRVAGRLRTLLQQHDIDVWLDIDHQANSIETWRSALTSAMASSDYFLALLGPHGVGLEQEQEINYALDLKKEKRIGLIFVLIRGYDESKNNPFADFLQSNYNYHDLRGGLGENAVRTLASIVRQDIIDAPVSALVPGSTTGGSRVLTFSGGSGSGTGHLCKVLAERLDGALGKNSCAILEMSRYYTGSAHTRAVEFTNTYGAANFDNPQIIDFDQMVRDVESLRRGLPIHSQDYNKQKHAPNEYESILPPTHFVLLEGVYLLQEQQIRNVSDLTVYVELDPEIRFARRIWKDVKKFQMELAEVLNYYFHAVKPAFEKWVRPYQDAARLSLNLAASDHAELDLDSAANRVIDFLEDEQLIKH
jgi:uridine kinase